MAEREVIEQDDAGSIVVYRDDPAERDQRILRTGEEAKQALKFTKGQLRTLRSRRPAAT